MDNNILERVEKSAAIFAENLKATTPCDNINVCVTEGLIAKVSTVTVVITSTTKYGEVSGKASMPSHLLDHRVISLCASACDSFTQQYLLEQKIHEQGKILSRLDWVVLYTAIALIAFGIGLIITYYC